MAESPLGGFGTNHALTVKKWSVALFREALGDLYFQRFVGKNDKSIIQQKFDFTKDAGDTITFALLKGLKSAGVTDDDELEGNEEALEYAPFSVGIFLRGNSVKLRGKMTRQRTLMDMRADAKTGLADWLKQKLEHDIIRAACGMANDIGKITASAPSANRVFFGGQNSSGTLASVSDLASVDSTTNHLFGTEVIKLLKRKAKMARPRIRPAIVDGKEYYCAWVHPLHSKSLTSEDAWLKAQREANVRGSKNPIFSGALGVFDGVVIHEHDGLPFANTGETFDAGDEAGTTAARGVLTGAQALTIGYAQTPAWMEKEFDYQRKPGVATDVIYGIAKTKFEDEDYGLITFNTAVVPD